MAPTSETLESVIFQKLAQHGWNLARFECNLDGEIRSRLGEAGLPPDLRPAGERGLLPG